MGNGANTFGLNAHFFSGFNGDLTASGGNIKSRSFQFPSRNTVYVSNDYANLSGRGVLAYGTLYEAVNSWRSGIASGLFGMPTVVNQATIVLDAGEVQIIPVGLPQNTKVNIDFDFLNIIGQGIDSTVLKSSGSYTANQSAISASAPYFSLQDFTFNGDDVIVGNNILGINISTTSDCNALIQNLRFYSRGNTFSHQAISVGGSFGFVGIIKDCIFDGYLAGGVQQVSFSAPFNGIMDGCRFLTNSGTSISLHFGNTQHRGTVMNCSFSGSPDTCFIFLQDASYYGEINDCYFYSPTSGVPAIINVETSAESPARTLIRDCTFEMQGTCMSGQFSVNTRIYNCYMRTEQGDQSCIKMYPTSFGNPSQITILGSRLIGAGTGLALEAVHTGVSNCVLAGNITRMPNGDVAGTSISNQIVNVALTPFNTELPSSLAI